MITVEKIGGANNKSCAEIRGLSTDTKPTVGVPNGSTFYEFDTVKLYVYDEESSTWLEQ